MSNSPSKKYFHKRLLVMDTKINTTNFKANIKITPFTKKILSEMSTSHFERFITAQRVLNQLPIKDELIITRKRLTNGQLIPVLTNLTNGAMLLPIQEESKKLTTNIIKIIEDVSKQQESYARRIFSRNINVINNSINRVFETTKELINHPIPPQKLNPIELDEKQILLMKDFENKYTDREVIFQLSELKKLFIKSYDEGYIYYICDTKNKPTGEFFTVTYSKNGFRINYDEKLLTREKVIKYFNRYTSKSLER